MMVAKRELFTYGQVFQILRYTWKAYPKLQPLPPEDWASFRSEMGHFCCSTSFLKHDQRHLNLPVGHDTT